MMLTIIMNHIVAMVFPRPSSPEISDAKERYDTVAKLNPIPQAPKANKPRPRPSHQSSDIRKAACGESTTPRTHSARPITI